MKRKAKTFIRVLLSVFGLVFANGFYFVLWRQDKAMDKIRKGENLNLYECFSAYTMNMATWMFGWPFSPEAARECFLLHFPQKDTVTFRHFNLSSPKMDKALSYLEGEDVGTGVKISWNAVTDYSFSNPERRAAIAVNPCIIEKKESPSDEGRCYYSITSPMLYPQYSPTLFTLGKMKIKVHEGLLRHLQDRGWLSVYVARYDCMEAYPASSGKRVKEKSILSFHDSS